MGKDDWRRLDLESLNSTLLAEKVVKDSTSRFVKADVVFEVRNPVWYLVKCTAWTAVWTTIREDLRAKNYFPMDRRVLL